MSLKAIEMQIALPRTFDAGKIQEQLHQRGQVMQDHISQHLQQEDERKRKKIGKSEQKQDAKLDSQQGTSKEIFYHHQTTEKTVAKDHQIENHPYKGTVIDFSG